MQWGKIRLNMFFLSQNNQNRLQNKLVNMVNGNDVIKQNYWPYLYLTYVFWYIFLIARLLQPFLKICVIWKHWNMKHWTSLDIWVQIIFHACFYIIWVCWIRICRLTFYRWCHSHLKKQNKNGRQNHICSIFLLHIIAWFLVSAWFRVDTFMSHVFR